VALIDLKLEDRSGLELMREIKECFPATECIVLTGYASQESAIEAINLGAYSYEQKPYDMEQLLMTIRRAIEKREAEEALRESEQEKSLILASLSELVSHQDKDLRIVWANRAAAESVDSAPEQLVGHHCYRIWQQRDDPCPDCPVMKAIETGQLQEAEIASPNGRAWSIRGYPIREANGDIEGAIEITLEITERKRVERSLQKYTAQLEALRQVGLELTAELDLNSLLHSIASRATELLGGTAGGIHLYRPERDLLEWTNVVGPSPAPAGMTIRRGEGLSGRVWETGEPLIVNDYQHWEGLAPSLEGLPNVAVAGAPMHWGDEFLGVLLVEADPPRSFSPSDAELLSLLATQAAIAIRNARLYEESRSRAERLAVFNRIAKAVGTVLDLDELMETVYQEVTSVFQADAFFITLYDEEANELDFRIQVDEGIREPPQRQPLEVGLTSRVITKRKPLLIQDLAQERDGLPPPSLWGTMKLSASWLGVPMLIGERLIGVICVQSYQTHAYGEEEELLLSTLADQVALAIEQARLYEAEREQRELAEALEEAAAAVNSTLEPDQVLDRILEQVERVVAGDAFNIMLMEDNTARVVRSRGYEQLGMKERIANFVSPVTELSKVVQMVQAGEPLAVSDTFADPGWAMWDGWEWLRSYVGTPICVSGQTVGILNVDGTSPGQFGPADAHRLKAFADAAATAIENARLFEQAQQELAERKRAEGELQQSLEQLQRTLEGTIEVLVSTIGMRDPYTASHQRQATRLAIAIAKKMQLSEERIQGLRMAGLIHDLGKITIPAEILSKPGALSDLEYGMIRMHVQAGHNVLKEFDFPWPVAQIVLQHHERMDGSGYPQGLSGEDILLEARILAAADVVTAMASHRPYRSSLGIDKALDEIAKNQGVLYDEDVVDACLRLFTEEGFKYAS
jgi:response regulator RpfG family c-di-GMP phosphodiesterase/putative methionine-R-sulfoxide reductase with GAF domain